MEHTILEHRFVQHAPQDLEGGILYISMECCTVIHLCCCGCGREVVTPLSPTDWKMTFDGEAVSLIPSIGNWNLPCRSHYFIRRNGVVEAPAWSNKMVNESYRRDQAAKAAYYAKHSDNVVQTPKQKATTPDETPNWWARLTGWFWR